VALLTAFVLPDYPATTKRLSVRERAMAVYRMEKDGGSKDEDDKGLLANVRMAATDYRVSRIFRHRFLRPNTDLLLGTALLVGYHHHHQDHSWRCHSILSHCRADFWIHQSHHVR